MKPQIYKIYANGIPIFLCSPQEAKTGFDQTDKNIYIAPYTGDKRLLLQYIDLVEKNQAVKTVVLFYEDVEKLWSDFQSCYQWVEAAGGFVQNAENQLLVFFRLDSWDLPKGKIDPGESPEQAAVREVQEETGLQTVHLGPFITATYHTYPHKGKQVLKKTWWYRMQTPDTEVTPQTEENIVEIRWVDAPSWIQTETRLYASIRDVILLALQNDAQS